MADVFSRARLAAPCLMVMEDLDSMIDDKNRSFLLNELDGFEANNGICVLATTNHADRLDSAITDRPSRFDRKYYFRLPDLTERHAYITDWNNSLENDLRISAAGTAEIAALTAEFSFAYLKELFVSAMMQWVRSDANGSIDQLVREQSVVLRGQMKSANAPPPATKEFEPEAK